MVEDAKGEGGSRWYVHRRQEQQERHRAGSGWFWMSGEVLQQLEEEAWT